MSRGFVREKFFRSGYFYTGELISHGVIFGACPVHAGLEVSTVK